jgi:hypothetical protein
VTKLFGISTSPFANTVKRLVFDEVATLNTLDVPFAVVEATLKVTDDDVALIPATVPLSKNDEVPSVVEVSQRVTNPRSPPVRPPIVVQSVEVPVLARYCPTVPVALVESRSSPVICSFDTVVEARVVSPPVAVRVVPIVRDPVRLAVEEMV